MICGLFRLPETVFPLLVTAATVVYGGLDWMRKPALLFDVAELFVSTREFELDTLTPSAPPSVARDAVTVVDGELYT